jgi:hypothetical protein
MIQILKVYKCVRFGSVPRGYPTFNLQEWVGYWEGGNTCVHKANKLGVSYNNSLYLSKGALKNYRKNPESTGN